MMLMTRTTFMSCPPLYIHQAQAEEFGVDTKVLATMSQAELTMRSEAEASLRQNNRKGGGGRQNKKVQLPSTLLNLRDV